MAQEKKIIVNTSKGHNKFWMLVPHPTITERYQVRNGRLGTNGQLQANTLNTWDGLDKLQDKVKEGYRRVNEREFELLNTQAAVVGSTNKCEELWWAEKSSEYSHYRYIKVADDILANPAYEPNLIVRMETRKEVAGSTHFVLVFTPEGSYLLNNWCNKANGVYTGYPVAINDKELKKMVEKVEASMGRLFAG